MAGSLEAGTIRLLGFDGDREHAVATGALAVHGGAADTAIECATEHSSHSLVGAFHGFLRQAFDIDASLDVLPHLCGVSQAPHRQQCAGKQEQMGAGGGDGG